MLYPLILKYELDGRPRAVAEIRAIFSACIITGSNYICDIYRLKLRIVEAKHRIIGHCLICIVISRADAGKF